MRVSTCHNFGFTCRKSRITFRSCAIQFTVKRFDALLQAKFKSVALNKQNLINFPFHSSDKQPSALNTHTFVFRSYATGKRHAPSKEAKQA